MSSAPLPNVATSRISLFCYGRFGERAYRFALRELTAASRRFDDSCASLRASTNIRRPLMETIDFVLRSNRFETRSR